MLINRHSRGGVLGGLKFNFVLRTSRESSDLGPISFCTTRDFLSGSENVNTKLLIGVQLNIPIVIIHSYCHRLLIYR